MKNIYKIIIIAIAVIVGSCNSDLDLAPKTALAQEDIDRLVEENPDKMLSGLLSEMYRSMLTGANASDHCTYGQNGVNMIFTFMGNDLSMYSSNTIGWFDYSITYRSSNHIRSGFFWRLYYKYITNSNFLLRTLSKDESTLTVNAKMAKATALAFRGHAYFYLATIYQFPYSDTNKSLPGVPIVTDDTPKGVDQPRSTVEQTYAQALDDLTNAQRLFTEIGMVKRASTLMDATTCAIYLARLHQAMGHFDLAEVQANLVIANYPVLTGRTQLWHGFNDVEMPNVVLGFNNTIETRLIYASNFAQYDPYLISGYVSMYPRFAFNGLMDKINVDDDRFFWWSSPEASIALGEAPVGSTHSMLRDTPYRMSQVAPPSPAGKEVLYQSIKFIGVGRSGILADPTLRGGKGTLDWDLGDNIYLRSEEAYLIKAEALAQQDKLGDAKIALESFVKTRNATYVCPVSAKQDLINEIQIQKRVEFWGEGLEFLDNKRLGVPIDRLDKPGFVSNHASEGKIFMMQTEKNLIFQLPDTEVLVNLEIGPENQNP